MWCGYDFVLGTNASSHTIHVETLQLCTYIHISYIFQKHHSSSSPTVLGLLVSGWGAVHMHLTCVQRAVCWLCQSIRPPARQPTVAATFRTRFWFQVNVKSLSVCVYACCHNAASFKHFYTRTSHKFTSSAYLRANSEKMQAYTMLLTSKSIWE